MRRASKGWITVIGVVTFLCLIFLMPTFLGDSLPSWWGKVFPKKGLRLGLDLKGGVYLLLGVESGNAVDHELSGIRESIVAQAKEKGILLRSVTAEGKSLTVTLFSKSDLKKTKELRASYADIASISEGNLSFTLTLNDAFIKQSMRKAID